MTHAIRGTCVMALVLLLLLAIGPRTVPLQQEQKARTITVCPEGPPTCQFAKIEEAIADANPDDVIFIQAGTYEETLVVEKSLQLVGAQEGQVRIRSVEPGRPTVTLWPQEDARVLLENLTIFGGRPSGPVTDNPASCFLPGRACPGGLVIRGSGSLVVTMVGVQITQGSGAAAALSCFPETDRLRKSLQAFVIRSQFTNSFTGIAWGACASQKNLLYLQDVTASDNQDVGILIAAGLETPSQVIIERSQFLRNDLGLVTQGDGIDLTIRDSWFLHNRERGAAVIFRFNGAALIQGSYFIGNDIGLSWGPLPPLETHDDFLLLENSFLIGNKKYGLYIDTPEPMIARNNLLQSNDFGVVAFQADKGIKLDENQIIGNRKWGVALFRRECGIEDSDFIFELAAKKRVVILGEGNEMRDNGSGDLCPFSYPWPPNFQKP